IRLVAGPFTIARTGAAASAGREFLLIPSSVVPAARTLSVPVSRFAPLIGEQFWQPSGFGLREVETVHRLGESKVCVDARDHDPGVDSKQLDPHDRNPYVGIDDESFVENEIEYVRQTAGPRRPGDRSGLSHQPFLLRPPCPRFDVVGRRWP